jgi:hypothetical protein
MRPWLLMFGTVLASIGLQAVQAQVTIDITEITCNQFLGSQINARLTIPFQVSLRRAQCAFPFA